MQKKIERYRKKLMSYGEELRHHRNTIIIEDLTKMLNELRKLNSQDQEIFDLQTIVSYRINYRAC